MRAALMDLALKYFRQKGYKIEQDAVREGSSGLPRKFDLFVERGKEQKLVWLRQWKRTVGVNMVINMDKAAADVGLPNPLMIAEKFSGHAKAYANRRGLILLTRRDIMGRLG
jgi:hypothetical protein